MHEENEKDLIKAGYKKYKSEEIDVFFHAGKCTHAANCIKYLPSTFNMNRKPWVEPSASLHEDVKRVIATCPSNALHFIEHKSF
ncbi:(4Fe-4S)-binding protein [Psychrobacillus vulpis]|uniref:Divergent 4Fe-4S mono-cluster domain-containing protein n=1 Tax=Psychrobacillus vulpis TaxID=2325572 RepID=A0A544TT13_9BACI|nr:(4Fe-4S)-binding protein [Psychrobacillus vulpis]TQR20596.1 hypothetical protein FG384_05725 [Psychrobacillus vulpis]